MLNFRSDELRRAKTTESTAPAVTQQQRQLHFGVRPRSSTSRDDDEIQSANSSKRMPDLQPRTTRAGGMSGGCVDALRRAIALEHERAEAAAAAVKNKQQQQQQQRPRAYTTTTSSFSRFDQIEMETKRMMGWSSRGGGASVSGKDRDLGGYEKRGRVGGRDHSDPNSDDDEEEEEEDGVMQELQMRPRTDSLGFIPVDDHRTLAAGATSYEHEYDPEFDLIDEDEGDGDGDGDPGCYLVDTPELAAFLGVTIPLHQQQRQQQYPRQQRQAYPPPMFPKAASFSGQHYSQYYQSQNQSQPQSLRGMVPCSPPVPIPPKQMLRRRNSVTGSLLTTHPSSSSSRKYGSGRGDVLCDESNYSRTQCEARLWDEDWNFKLSLEARESFEASNKNTNSSSRSNSASGRAVWKPQSTSSMASTADTFRDDDDDVIGSFGGMGVGGENNDSGDEDEADQVFDMDDL